MTFDVVNNIPVAKRAEVREAYDRAALKEFGEFACLNFQLEVV